jgi:hypothetical protein
MLVRHSSCLQARTNMLDTTSASVVIRDLGFDMLTDGSVFGNSILNITRASSVDISGSYFTHAQAVGIAVIQSDNIRIYSNYFKENWLFGASIANGNGGTLKPIYNHGFSFVGNTCENMPICVASNFFIEGVAITSNVLNHSSIAVIQSPSSKGIVANNTINGTATYGCGSSCSIPAATPAIYLEGGADTLVSANLVESPAGPGIICQGSNLEIPTSTVPWNSSTAYVPGSVIVYGGISYISILAGANRQPDISSAYWTSTRLQMPCSNLTIIGNQVRNVNGGFPILVSAASTDQTPGSQILIDGNQILDSYSCITVAGAQGLQETNNQCNNTAFAGYFLGSVTKSIFRGNLARNVSRSSGNFHGLEINGASQDIDVDGNTFVCDPGTAHCMQFGVHDATLEGGGASQVRHCGNTIRGAAAGSWFPMPAIPVNGTWSLNDCIESFPVTRIGSTAAPNRPLEWRNILAGTPGEWAAFGTAIAPP